MDMQPQDKQVTTRRSKYAELPPPLKWEDLRTSEDVVPHPEVVGEADRERDWLLRTAGLL